MNFSSTCLVGTKRNNNFYFPYFSSFSDLFWLEMNHYRISFIFWIFYYFYWIFYYASVMNGTEWNNNFCFSLSHLFRTYFGLEWILNGSFWIFLLFFWNFQLRIGQERNGTIIFIFLLFFLEFSITQTERSGTIIFIFSLSQPCQACFGLKWIHNDIF